MAIRDIFGKFLTPSAAGYVLAITTFAIVLVLSMVFQIDAEQIIKWTLWIFGPLLAIGIILKLLGRE